MVTEWLREQPGLWDTWQGGGKMFDAFWDWQAARQRPVMPKGVFCRVLKSRFKRSVLRREGKPTICYLILQPAKAPDRIALLRV